MAAWVLSALLLVIFLEYLFCKYFNRDCYHPVDTLSNLAAGVLTQSIRPFTKILGFAVYAFIYDNWRLYTLTASSLVLLPCYFLLLDFCFYWSHRATHRLNFLWALHIVHHQSERLNYSVAFRRSAFAPLLTFVFELPLALLGLPLTWFVVLSAVNIFYQFLLHTETIGKLGVLEIFMNTPSHHRVHHGREQKYLDKNFASVFIIWDKLFWTFQAEEETPDYGVTIPPSAFNPITANIHYYQVLWHESQKHQRLLDKLRLWFLPPERIKSATPPQLTNYSKVYQHVPRLPHLLPLLFYCVVVLLLALVTLSAWQSKWYVISFTLLLIVFLELPFKYLLKTDDLAKRDGY